MALKWWSLKSVASRGVVLLPLLLAGIAGQHAVAETQAAKGVDREVAAGAEPQAKELLMGMARLLAATPSFSVSLRTGYDVPQASGQMIEFNEKRKVVVNRPQRLRVESEESDGEQQLLLIDGNTITVSSLPQNVYGQITKVGTIDDALVYFLRDLRMRLPLALMLTNTFPAQLERRVTSVDYVETTSILGVPSHHLAARTNSGDFQVWVSADGPPLPLRIVLTYTLQEGNPQFWANFSDWNLAPKHTYATFTFTVPAEARKIPFLTELSKVAVEESEVPTPTGEHK